ncbi:hypothetical protein [Photobacterium jeanii]|uniref:hypothetical protein n=1 Tax=Photobacterium jeanii TaxID=858640 RepID=UPI000AC070B0|nr:hypothetical protein [Photobacterium jeanii]
MAYFVFIPINTSVVHLLVCASIMTKNFSLPHCKYEENDDSIAMSLQEMLIPKPKEVEPGKNT